MASAWSSRPFRSRSWPARVGFRRGGGRDVLGALESIASFSLGSGWREVPGLVLLILALAVRPTGVFGKATIRKV